MVEKEAVKGNEILTNPARCVGCFRCALVCSFRFEKAFNPYYARIKIVPAHQSTVFGEVEISFSNGCDGCGICVKACLWRALTLIKAQ